MKKIFFIILLTCILSACSNNSDQEKHEGIIVNIEETVEEGNPHHGWYYMLVISEVEDISFLDKTEDELIKIAQENNGAYYSVNPDIHEELELKIGTKIAIYYNGQGDQNPPLRNTEKIDVLAR